ncbi:MAG: 23S rRNA (uracil(1939)-C(5))-methyltransferase RlmD [Cyanobacteria bacterium SIG30]|nr:23S rRNA (uracil(1939)-C(5))-methyltransferase RlmD [Cyanobacteria bacterium SIG30]
MLIKIGDIVDVKIEKIVYEGYGLARIDNFVIFVDNAVPLDLLKVEIKKVNKKFANAKIIEIINPSPHRIKPECHLFNACGACNLQFVNYDFLLKCKKQIVEEALSIKVNDVIASPKIFNYRCKSQYPVTETKNSKRVIAGYYKPKSHEIVNIKYCMAQDSVVDEIIQYIRDNWSFGCYVEKKHSGLLRHIVVKKSSSTNEILVVLVLNSDNKVDLVDFFENLTKKFPDIKGCLINYNSEKTNKILGSKTETILGQNFYTEILDNKTYKIGAESFFQVNPACAVNIFNEVKKAVKPNSTVLDCYGGVGAIGVWLSDIAKKVTLIEINEDAVNFAHENFKNNNVKNYEIILGDAKEKLNGLYDYAIIDPPRKGADFSFLQKLSSITNNIIYVSCNPLTLARDIKVLKDFNFEVKYVQPIDMFPFTYHIENVCILEKKS